MLTPGNPKIPGKTDQADQIGQIDRLTGHLNDTFSVELFSHLADLSVFTFSVDIIITFSGPVVFLI